MPCLCKQCKFRSVGCLSFSMRICIKNLDQGQLEVGVASYSKCLKISYTTVSDKIAYTNIVDPDQTAPEGAV